jgi:hypothetical protein
VLGCDYFDANRCIVDYPALQLHASQLHPILYAPRGQKWNCLRLETDTRRNENPALTSFSTENDRVSISVADWKVLGKLAVRFNPESTHYDITTAEGKVYSGLCEYDRERRALRLVLPCTPELPRPADTGLVQPGYIALVVRRAE